MAAPAGDIPQLLQFFAGEMQLFFSHISSAVEKFAASGELPHSVFSAKAAKALGPKSPSSKRKREEGGSPKKKKPPSTFNLFVKEKLEELKRTGAGGEGGSQTSSQTGNFRDAVASWGKLTEEQKAQYVAKYAPVIASWQGGAAAGPSAAVVQAPAAAAIPSGAAAVVPRSAAEDSSSEEEAPAPVVEKKKKRKKKKKHHKERKEAAAA